MSADLWALWVLGSGTALPSARRDNTYLALEIGRAGWLIDCGAAPYQRLLQAGIPPLALRGVVLTHSHTDHLYGLPTLLFQLALAGYQEVLPIYGLAETLRVARQVVEAFELGEHCAAHEWRALESGSNIRADALGAGFIQVAEVRHSRPALGVRITAPSGWSVAYSGDTQPCPAIVELACGVEWLLHECTVSQPLAGHSTPEDVGRTAMEAGARRVGVVHYDPVYVVGQEELLARVHRAGFTGEVRVLQDMEVISPASAQDRGGGAAGAFRGSSCAVS